VTLRLGPDSARYWLAAQGKQVARPFHLRWLLPAACGINPARWWVVWALSWPILGVGVFFLADLGWERSLFAAVLVLALPGVWGPSVVRPVGVDLPAMALGACAAAAAVHGVWWAAIPLVCLAACIKESAPVWAALWAWHPALLVGLILVAFTAAVVKPGMDEITSRPDLAEIHAHPFRTALRARQWRDAWVMVAPWGVCLAALYAPSWPLVAVLAVAHLQLLVATDTVRLVHTAAGPVAAIAAATVLPVAWLPLFAVAHVFWWRTPEVV